MANDSGLRLSIGPVNLASLAFADDEALVSKTINEIQALIHIVEAISNDTNLRNVPSKTNVLVINPKPSRNHHSPLIDPNDCLITMGGEQVYPVQEATYVGLLRSSTLTNIPAILAKISGHKRALHGLIHQGMVKNHGGIPAAGLRAKATYCSPVLLNCLSALYLSDPELKILNVYIRKTLHQVQRLCIGTPAPVLHFL